jgi:hypothetical protein
MLFAPSETDGFQLVHTAKQYLEVVHNPGPVVLDPSIPIWDGESMDVDVLISPSPAKQKLTLNSE